jgi:hypothetical protein
MIKHLPPLAVRAVLAVIAQKNWSTIVNKLFKKIKECG